METVKAIVDGEEIDVVIKLDDEVLFGDTLIKDDDTSLEDTIDLTEELNKNAETRNE